MPQASPKTVIFVCTGNFYRSRFSEYLFNARAARRGLPWRATSRGLQTWLCDGQGPISSHTVRRLKAMGIPVEAQPRFPQQLSLNDLQTADLVVAVKEAEHRAMMEEQFPDWVDRIEYWHVDDLDCATAEESLPHCELCVETLVARLASEAHTRPRRLAPPRRKAG